MPLPLLRGRDEGLDARVDALIVLNNGQCQRLLLPSWKARARVSDEASIPLCGLLHTVTLWCLAYLQPALQLLPDGL